nr:PREDICTED: uncharacterized protein LOC107982602 [Anolis carolinensis]|eukprot:XP_016847593.1 PREDICTED: uncharacterized protein LOC107982602 [Anolis carolinensis]
MPLHIALSSWVGWSHQDSFGGSSSVSLDQDFVNTDSNNSIFLSLDCLKITQCFSYCVEEESMVRPTCVRAFPGAETFSKHSCCRRTSNKARPTGLSFLLPKPPLSLTDLPLEINFYFFLGNSKLFYCTNLQPQSSEAPSQWEIGSLHINCHVMRWEELKDLSKGLSRKKKTQHCAILSFLSSLMYRHGNLFRMTEIVAQIHLVLNCWCGFKHMRFFLCLSHQPDGSAISTRAFTGLHGLAD